MTGCKRDSAAGGNTIELKDAGVPASFFMPGTRGTKNNQEKLAACWLPDQQQLKA